MTIDAGSTVPVEPWLGAGRVERRVEAVEVRPEGRDHVLDGEGGAAVDRVEGPGGGRAAAAARWWWTCGASPLWRCYRTVVRLLPVRQSSDSFPIRQGVNGPRSSRTSTCDRACTGTVAIAARRASKSAPHVRQGPGRQPRRDRRAGHPGARRAGHRAASRSTRRPTATRCTSGAPARRTCSARARPRSPTSPSTACWRRSSARAPRRCIPATASWPRTRPSRGGWRRRASPSSARRRPRSRRWAPRPARASSCRPPACRSCPGPPRPWRRSRRRATAAAEIGYPVAVKAAGGGGGKGFRVALDAGALPDAFDGRRARGREVLLRPDGVPGALPARPAPRRGAGAGRRARRRDPPRRARLLDPAPPPEADRGGAGAAGRRRAARAHRPHRHGRGAGGGLPRRGHDRGPAGRRASTSSSR